MLKRIISRLDIKNQTLVKGINLEGLRSLGNPNYFAKKYYEEGIDEIHYHDVVASLYGRNSLKKIISECAKNIFVAVCVGGGLRNLEDIDSVLKLGADKISLNSAAVRKPDLIKSAVNVYGSSTISINVETAKINDKYEVLIESGREKTGVELFNWIEKIQEYGAGEIILTSIDKEGRKKGFDLDLYRNVKKKTSIPLIAHGGAGKAEDIYQLFDETNVEGVLLSSILHYSYLDKTKELENDGKNNYLKNSAQELKNSTSIFEIKKFLINKGINVRNEEK